MSSGGGNSRKYAFYEFNAWVVKMPNGGILADDNGFIRLFEREYANSYTKIWGGEPVFMHFVCNPVVE